VVTEISLPLLQKLAVIAVLGVLREMELTQFVAVKVCTTGGVCETYENE
jgi:hypothetical protein